MTTIDLSPLVNGVLIPLLSPILLAIAGWALAKVAAYAHFQVQDGQRAMLDTAIGNAITFAQQKLAPHETVNADATVAAAVSYLLPKVPDALKNLGVTPDHLAQLITARLPPTPAA